jgi:hypothetical protein
VGQRITPAKVPVRSGLRQGWASGQVAIKLAQSIGHLVAQGLKIRRQPQISEVVLVEIHREALHNPTRAGRQDVDLLGQQQRLVDVVGDQ